jgi:hypothetical protein
MDPLVAIETRILHPKYLSMGFNQALTLIDE